MLIVDFAPMITFPLHLFHLNVFMVTLQLHKSNNQIIQSCVNCEAICESCGIILCFFKIPCKWNVLNIPTKLTIFFQLWMPIHVTKNNAPFYSLFIRLDCDHNIMCIYNNLMEKNPSYDVVQCFWINLIFLFLGGCMLCVIKLISDHNKSNNIYINISFMRLM